MICGKCGMSFKDSLSKCPYCDEPNPEYKISDTNEDNMSAEETTDEQTSESNTNEKTDENIHEEIQQSVITDNAVKSDNEPKSSQTQAPSNGIAIASMVCGIIALPLIFTSIGGIIMGIVAIVLATYAKRQNGQSGFAVAGLVCGIIALIISVIVLIITIAIACTFVYGGVSLLSSLYM